MSNKRSIEFVDIDAVTSAQEALSVDYANEYAGLTREDWAEDFAGVRGNFAEESAELPSSVIAVGDHDLSESVTAPHAVKYGDQYYYGTADRSDLETVFDPCGDGFTESEASPLRGGSYVAQFNKAIDSHAVAYHDSALPLIEEVKSTDFAAEATCVATDDFTGDAKFYDDISLEAGEGLANFAEGAVGSGVRGAAAAAVSAAGGFAATGFYASRGANVAKAAATSAFDSILDHDSDEVEGSIQSAVGGTRGAKMFGERVYSKATGRALRGAGKKVALHRQVVSGPVRQARLAAAAKSGTATGKAAAAAAGVGTKSAFAAVATFVSSGIAAISAPVVAGIGLILGTFAMGAMLVCFIFSGVGLAEDEVGDGGMLAEVALAEYEMVHEKWPNGGDEAEIAKKYWEFVNGASTPQAWCACFASWCMNECGFMESGWEKSAWHHSFLTQCKADDTLGTIHKNDGSYVPNAGDLAIRCSVNCGEDCGNGGGEGAPGTNEHVAIVVEVSKDGKIFSTVGGNEGDTVSKAAFQVEFNSFDWFITPNGGASGAALSGLGEGETLNVPATMPLRSGGSLSQSGISFDDVEYTNFAGNPPQNYTTALGRVARLWAGAGKKSKQGIATYNYKGNTLYCAAVSPYFGAIGDVIDVRLKNGSVINILVCDTKGEDAASTWGHKQTKSDATKTTGISCIEWEGYNGYSSSKLAKQKRSWYGQPIVSVTNYGNILK